MTDSFDLHATVDANVQPYERSIENAKQATFKYETSLQQLNADIMRLEKQLDDDLAAALNRQHTAMDKTGRAAFGFGLAIAAGLGLAANEAIKWESQWTGVTKTVNGSASEMADLEAGLRGLTKVLPSSHEEIAAVAEAAGQLGIQRDNIVDFTKVMIDLGQTTDLSAEDAATSLAQLMNVMQTAPKDVDHLGNTLVALGNNGASTESQILNMAVRTSGAMALVGGSEQDLLGLSSAMADLGIRSELGGGAIQRTFLIINSAVKGGGEKLEEFANLAGVSSDRFAREWETSPVRAFTLLADGMGKVKAEGGDVAQALDDVGIKGTQNLSVLLRLAGAGDHLTNSLDMANSSWDTNNALLKEAEKRYGTTESKMMLARNQLRDTAIDVGEVLVPAIAAFARVTADVLGAWQDLPGPLKTGAVILAALTAGIALFGGAALIAIPKIYAFKTAVSQLEAGALKTAGTRLQGLGGILAGPWGLALTAGIGLLGLFAAKHEETQRTVAEVADTLDKETGAVTENTREWAKKKLYDDGALQAAASLGLNLETVTNAMLGNKDAIAAVDAELDKHIVKLGQSTSGNSDLTGAQVEASNSARIVAKTIGTGNDTLDDARNKLNLFAQADGEVADASDKVTGAQKGTTAAWSDGADAASDLSGEVKTLGEQLEELSDDYLSNRDAGRQVRDSLRGIDDAMKEYKKNHKGSLEGAFKAGTESGDKFAGMLDDLAQRYQTQIDTTEQLTGSEKRTMAVYRDSRQRLMEVAQQLGMTKDQAKAYVDQVLQVPAVAKTLFQTPGLDQANFQVSALQGSLMRLPPRVVTEVVTVRSTEWRSGGGGGSDAPQTHHADGGFSFGRDPQLRTGGGAIMWNEPETGWEAYISGKPGKESRNQAVWAEAGRRLGFSAPAGRGGGHTERIVERIVERLPDTIVLRSDALGDVVIDTVESRIEDYRDLDRSRAATVSSGAGND